MFQLFYPDMMKVQTLDPTDLDPFQFLLKLSETTNIMSFPSYYSGRVVGCPGNRGSHVVCPESGGKHATLKKYIYYIHMSFPEQSLSSPLHRPLFVE